MFYLLEILKYCNNLPLQRTYLPIHTCTDMNTHSYTFTQTRMYVCMHRCWTDGKVGSRGEPPYSRISYIMQKFAWSPLAYWISFAGGAVWRGWWERVVGWRYDVIIHHGDSPRTSWWSVPGGRAPSTHHLILPFHSLLLLLHKSMHTSFFSMKIVNVHSVASLTLHNMNLKLDTLIV